MVIFHSYVSLPEGMFFLNEVQSWMTVALPNFKMQVRLIATWQVGSQPPVSGLAISCQGSRFDLLGRTKHIVPQWYGIYIDIPYDILIRITSYTFMYHDIMINTNIYIYKYVCIYILYILYILIIWYDLSFPYGLAIRSLCRGPCSGHVHSPRYPFPSGARRQGWGAVALSSQWWSWSTIYPLQPTKTWCFYGGSWFSWLFNIWIHIEIDPFVDDFWWFAY